MDKFTVLIIFGILILIFIMYLLFFNSIKPEEKSNILKPKETFTNTPIHDEPKNIQHISDSQDIETKDIDREDLSLTDTANEAINEAYNEIILPKQRSHVFFDISVNSIPEGRIIMELFDDIVPKTAKNFKVLCNNKYKGCIFHRVIKDFMIQGGDFENFDGTGGRSIYGDEFDDENFDLSHNSHGLLSMANHGPNTNGSQFFITLDACHHLDGKHVVFGRVIDGFDIVERIGTIFTRDDKPIVECKITDSGVLN